MGIDRGQQTDVGRFRIIGVLLLCLLCERTKNETVVRSGNGGGVGVGEMQRKTDCLCTVHLPIKTATTFLFTHLSIPLGV